MKPCRLKAVLKASSVVAVFGIPIGVCAYKQPPKTFQEFCLIAFLTVIATFLAAVEYRSGLIDWDKMQRIWAEQEEKLVGDYRVYKGDFEKVDLQSKPLSRFSLQKDAEDFALKRIKKDKQHGKSEMYRIFKVIDDKLVELGFYYC